jgi:hypothetical protein
MAYEPLMDGKAYTNVYGEHVFKIRATFGSSSAVTYRSKDATIAKSTTGTWTITLPKPYAEITSFHVGSKCASGTAPLAFVLTDISTLTTTGVLTLKSLDTNSAGTVTEPASGDIAYITIGVSCDVLNDAFTG